MRVHSRIRLIGDGAAPRERAAVDRSVQLAQRQIGAGECGARGQAVHDDARIDEPHLAALERDVAIDARNVERPGNRQLRRQATTSRDAGAANKRRQHAKVDVAVGDDRGLPIREPDLAEHAERCALSAPVP